VKIDANYVLPASVAAPVQGAPRPGSPVSFGSLLGEALAEVNQLQLRSSEATARMVAGEAEDIHQVMLASEQASLSLQLAVQVRNKLVEAYQEISRMQF